MTDSDAVQVEERTILKNDKPASHKLASIQTNIMIEYRDTDAGCPTDQPVVGSPMLSPERDPWDGPSASDMRSTGVGEDLVECDSFADRQDPFRGDTLSASQEISALP